MFTIRRLEAHEWRKYRALRLRALADSPDAFGSTLAIEEVRADAVWSERLAIAANAPDQFPVVAQLSTELVGLIWGRVNADTPHVAQVYQMWVAPECRGNGCGAMLLDALIAWAGNTSAEFVHLSVTIANSAAVRLYARIGFEPYGEPESLRADSPLFAQPMQLALRRDSRE
ncbi:MAG: GNAT family N-acetyltransferase [Gemmatimonadaceae bacterium]